MPLKKLPDHVGCIDRVGGFSDDALRQVALAARPEMSHAGDGVKNHLGIFMAILIFSYASRWGGTHFRQRAIAASESI